MAPPSWWPALGYVLASAVAFTAPQMAGVVTPVAMALGVGELPMGVWLLIWGARDQRARPLDAMT